MAFHAYHHVLGRPRSFVLEKPYLGPGYSPEEIRAYLEANRIGDHICYYSDLRKMMTHFPGWSITVPLATIFDEIVEAWQRRLA